MKKLGRKPRKVRRDKDVSSLHPSSAEYQIELAKRQLARIPEWLYTGPR
jgi:hypothetical protein